MARPSTRGELADGGLGVGLLAGGEDEHAAAQPGGDLLVAEHDLGEIRAGQVGEHHPVGGVAALGQGDAEAAVTKPSSSTACSTRRRVPASCTGAEPRRTRETVAIDTPARRATS